MLRNRSGGPAGLTTTTAAAALAAAALVAGAMTAAVAALGALPAPAAGAATTTTTGAATTTTAASTTTTAATHPLAAKTLLAASLAAAKSQRSVHFVAVSTIGSQSISITGDVGTAKSQEAIVVTDGGQSGHVTARLVHKAVYFRGDTEGLEGYLGMPSTLATKYTGRWIRFGTSSPTYKGISQAMTMKSAVGQISVKAPLASGPTATVDGVAAVSVTGTTTDLGSRGPSALYVPAQGSLLPLRYTGQGKEKKQKETGQVDFSQWGETFTVVAPTGSVAASSV